MAAAAGNGLNSHERAIMDAWEAGRSMEQIVEATGFSRDTVGSVVSMYRVTGREDRLREDAIRDASLRYADALAATGKVFR